MATKKSRAYVVKREKARNEWLKKQDAKLDKVIQDNLRDALEACYKEAAGWVANYAAGQKISMEEAIKAASQADMMGLARKAKRYVETKDFSPRANQEMKLYNFTMRLTRHEILMRNMDLELLVAFSESEKELDSHLKNLSMSELKRQVKILGMNADLDYEALTKNVASQSFHGMDFSSRIWANQATLRQKLEQGLIRSTLMGKHPTTWLKELRGELTSSFQGSMNAMTRIAVTESARVQTETQRVSYEKSSYDWFEFIAESTACKDCLALDAKKFPVSTMKVGINAAPMHPYCRCGTAASMGPEN